MLSRRAWATIRAWYRHAGDRPPKPSRQDLQQVTDERVALYTRDEPTGPPIPVAVNPSDISDDVPTEDEIANAVRRLKRGKAPGPSKMRADHVKDWLKDARRENPTDRSRWDHFVELVQLCFETGEFPSGLTWSTIVLLPKGWNRTLRSQAGSTAFCSPTKTLLYDLP